MFNIVTAQGGQTSVRSSRAEQVMTSAILNVTSEKQTKVSVLSGYNQSDISPFTTLLEMNNFEIIHENLVTIEDIDSNANIVLLVAPSRDISENDLRKLDRFLINNNEFGNTLFYITGAHEAPMSQFPNLSAWLREWGIEVYDSVLIEMEPAYRFSLQDPFIAFVDYSDNEIAQELSLSFRNRELLVASFYSRPLSVLFEERGFHNVNPLLQTTEFSGIAPEDGDLTNWNITGPHPVLVLSTTTHYQGATMLTSHVLVCGFLSSFNPYVLGEVNFANSEYFLELMNTLVNREDTVRIQDKTFSISSIQVTLAQVRILSFIFVILLPFGMIASGIVVWLRRRHR